MGMIDSLPNIWSLVLVFCFLKILLTLSPRYHYLSGLLFLFVIGFFQSSLGKSWSAVNKPHHGKANFVTFYLWDKCPTILLPSHFFFLLTPPQHYLWTTLFYKICFCTCKFHIHGFKELSAGIFRKAVFVLNRVASVLVPW